MEGAARSAAALGCHAFIVSDACRGAEAGPFEDLSHLAGPEAKIVTCAAALGAASVAKVRQRLAARKR